MTKSSTYYFELNEYWFDFDIKRNVFMRGTLQSNKVYPCPEYEYKRAINHERAVI